LASAAARRWRSALLVALALGADSSEVIVGALVELEVLGDAWLTGELGPQLFVVLGRTEAALGPARGQQVDSSGVRRSGAGNWLWASQQHRVDDEIIGVEQHR